MADVGFSTFNDGWFESCERVQTSVHNSPDVIICQCHASVSSNFDISANQQKRLILQLNDYLSIIYYYYLLSMYSSLVKFMKNLLLPTDLLLKTENSKAFIYLKVGAMIFLKN